METSMGIFKRRKKVDVDIPEEEYAPVQAPAAPVAPQAAPVQPAPAWAGRS